MAPPDVLQLEQDFLMWQSLFDNPKGENVVKSKGTNIEKKMEFLENLTGKVSNRRTRRWMNDRLLMELVPRLNAEEIRGLFAPPPWGDDVPLSAFCMTNTEDWDKIRSIDMDKEKSMMKSFEDSQPKPKNGDADKAAVITAWHRVDSRTRDAIRRKFLPELITIYEDCIREFIKGSGDADVLELNVQDSFHRLLLHGVCEFYNLVSITTTLTKGKETLKMTKISKKKKKAAASDTVIPVITLCNFLKMAKEGIW